MSPRLSAAMLLVLLPRAAAALPQYALASAHTCGNCHVSPTYEVRDGWNDPALSDRKCNLSCVACHVDPSGGGLRNTAGRYFGMSSLAILPLEERSYSDLDRELFTESARAFRRSFGEGGARTSSRSIPSDPSELAAGIGAEQSGGFSVFGKPFGDPSPWSLWDGRYRDLNADPLLALGGDVRFAYWSGAKTVFPMQLDLDAALHPIEHLTGLVTVAARGRVAGLAAIGVSQPAPVFLRNAFLMVHELPYLAYLKAGLFMPSFGTRIDDHTSFIRDDFDQDFSSPDDRVFGAELGFAANYPYASASVFHGSAPPVAPEGTDGGWGAALTAGWRAEGWSLGAHGMIKRRPFDAGGALDAAGVSWGFSPYRWWGSLPLSFIGELSIGRKPRAIDGAEVGFLALYQEAWWSVVNGVSIRAKYDLADRDLAGGAAFAQRASIGLDVALLPGLDLFAQARMIWEGASYGGSDVFVQLHLWF